MCYRWRNRLRWAIRFTEGRDVRKVTLQDLAESLGVARSTVSRALRADPQISSGTRERVQRLAAEVGYHPNAAARALTRRSAGVVGLVVPRTSRFVFSNPYFSELLEGISSIAEPAGFPILVSASERPDYAAWLREGRVDGIITLGSGLGTEDLALLESLSERGSPIVLVHPASAPTSLVTLVSDEGPGLRDACRHLADAGYDGVAIVTGPATSRYARARARGWQRAAEGVGMTIHDVLHGDDTYASGAEAARHLSGAGSAATAWVLGNDLMAFGALGALEATGRAVPDDVAVIGFDDVMPAAWVGLSTVSQPVRELGAEAMRALHALMRGASPRPSRLSTHFVPRRTTPPPGPPHVGASSRGGTSRTTTLG
jgi:DNA-binding LacI/PurR family transcriptional regulator